MVLKQGYAVVEEETWSVVLTHLDREVQYTELPYTGCQCMCQHCQGIYISNFVKYKCEHFMRSEWILENLGEDGYCWDKLRISFYLWESVKRCDTFSHTGLLNVALDWRALCDLKQRWVVVGIISQVWNKLTCGHRRIVRGEVADCDWGKSDGLWNGFMLEYVTVWIMVD